MNTQKRSNPLESCDYMASDIADKNTATNDAERDVDARYLHLAEEFCTSLLQERNFSPHTVRNYRTDLCDYGRWAARVGISPIEATHRQVRMYLAELDSAQYSRRTINRRLSALRSFFRWLVFHGYTDNDPVSVLQGPKTSKSLPHAISPADMKCLLGVWREKEGPIALRNQAILEFLYACGVRISEASSLLTRDVSFKSKQVKVFGKGSKERIVPLYDMAISSLRTYYAEARSELLSGKDCPYFFVSNRGGRMSTDTLRKLFKRSLEMAGLDTHFTPHDMRHTFATDLVEGGADLRSVQEMLGHTSLSTTQVYTHLSIAHLKDACHHAHPRG